MFEQDKKVELHHNHNRKQQELKVKRTLLFAYLMKNCKMYICQLSRMHLTV